MQSYKYLDNLCRDMNGTGVTGYINDMEQVRNGIRYVAAWDSDYRQLKHYRYIRNQIAHEAYATEETLCSPADTEWIEHFHQRILNQTDPLALYHKAHKQYGVSAPKQTAAARPEPAPRKSLPESHSPNSVHHGCMTAIITFLLFLLLLLSALIQSG